MIPEIIDINIIEHFNFIPFVGGWITGAISLGSSLLGGFSARKKAKKRARKVKAAARKNIERLNNQKPDIAGYYDTLDDMLLKDTETSVGRTVDDFTSTALNFNIKADAAVEGGKGLISGIANKSIQDNKEAMLEDSTRNMDDIYANFERTGMDLDNGRRRELQNIDDAIASLNMQIASV
tara:strand:- start:477 stop:1016 length:540 start_codon:yes stop_codon:yes gene_type:complete